MEGVANWQRRPLDPVYAMIFVDTINVKICEGQVANRPIYLALGVTTRKSATTTFTSSEAAESTAIIRKPAG